MIVHLFIELKPVFIFSSVSVLIFKGKYPIPQNTNLFLCIDASGSMSPEDHPIYKQNMETNSKNHMLKRHKG